MRFRLVFAFILLVPFQVLGQSWTGLLKPTSGAGACSPASISSPQQCAIDWTQVGIVGGIPSGSWTQSGSTIAAGANASTVQAALNACGTNHYVLLGPGAFTFNADVQIPSHCVLRGSGPQSTVITYTGTSGYPIYIGSKSGNAGDVPNMSNAVNITSGATAGSTSVVVASASNIAVGGLMVVTELNDLVSVNITTPNGTCNYCDAYLFHNTGTRVRGQTVKITGVSGTTITFTPALYTNYSNTPMASPYGPVSGSAPDATMAGVENLQLFATNSAPNSLVNGAMISLWHADEVWVKNVEDNWADSNHVAIGYCYRCEVRDSYFSNAFVHASGGSDVELQLAAWSSGVLIENNILERLHSSIVLEWGIAGNVIAYNYTLGTFDSAATNVTNEDIAFHGANPQFNLLEGNVTDDINYDAFWGSTTNNTQYRNLARGVATVCPYTDGTYTASGPGHKAVNWSGCHLSNQQNRSVTVTFDNTNVNSIGNVLGSQDASTASGGVLYNASSAPFTSTMQPTANRIYNGQYNAVNYGYNTGTDSNGSAIASFSSGPGPTTGYWVGLAAQSGFQHGNFDIASNSTIWNGSVTHTLPASFYLASKPSWWGSLAYPANGPDVTGGTIDSTILGGHAYGNPAYACYNSLGRDSLGVKLFDANTCYYSSPSVAAPTLSPSPGGYGSAQTVSISTSTSGATICYTTDSSTPTTNGAGSCVHGSIYSVPFTVSSTTTVKAIGTLSGSSDSSITTGVYTINGAAAAPSFSPSAGSYGPAQSVTLSSTTPSATICYTTDGSTPTADGAGSCTHGTTYSSAVSVSVSLTIKAIASKTGFLDSAVASAAYVINGAASTPTFSPVAGSYGPAQNVTLSSSTSGATICYTINGSTPASSSPGSCASGSTQYVSPIAVSTSLTIKAIATKTGFSDSSVASASYVINGAVSAPTFSPVAGIYTSSQNVTISTSTSGASCYYTTDGSIPTPSSTPYTTPITISSTTTLGAICTKTGFSNSSVTTGTYTIATGCTIGFSPGAGTFSNTQNVTITTSGCTAGTQVFYRTDGLPATNIDTQYSSPITVSGAQTLTAKAVISPTVRNQPQTISTQKKCNAIGSPITFPSGYSCNNGSGGVAGTASDFKFTAGTSNQMYVSTTDSTAFDTSILLIDTPSLVDNNIVNQSFRKVYQDTSNCSQTAPNKYKCIDVSETDAESCCDATTHALWQISVRCSTNAAGSSGNNGFLEGDASSGNEKWNIPCVIGAPTDLTVNTHWALGDTGCGGSGCMVIDSIYLNGTNYAFPASCDVSDTHCPNYPMTPQPTYGNFVAGSQDQVYARNVGVAGTSPLTTTRSISFSRVAVDEGSEATGSAVYAFQVATPTFSPVAGTYTSVQLVNISSATTGTTIYYTTDGSTPTTGSTPYTGPVTVSTSLTLKALAVKSGYTDSAVGSAAYVISPPTAPTLSGNVTIQGSTIIK